MKCPKCGYEYEGTKVNCPSCGESLARTKMNYSEEYNSVENRRKRSSKTIQAGENKDRFGEGKATVYSENKTNNHTALRVVIGVVLALVGLWLLIGMPYITCQTVPVGVILFSVG